MTTTFDQIISDLKNEKYFPVYFLSGEEPYYIDSISNYIANNVLNESERDFNQTIIYGKEVSSGAIKENALRYPMMSQYNVLIIKEAQEFKKFDELIPYFENPTETTILVICYKYKKIDKRTKLYKVLDKNACFFEGKKIYENKVASWIENYLKERNFSINQNASVLLTEYLGNDLSKVANELEKLVLIKNDNKLVTPEDIEKHIGISKDYNVFELQKALGQKDGKKVTRIVNYIKNNPKSTPIQMIIGSLYGYFSKLFVLTYSQDFNIAAKELGIMSFLHPEYKSSSLKYRGKLDKVIRILQEYDLKSKGLGDIGTDQSELTKELMFKILNA